VLLSDPEVVFTPDREFDGSCSYRWLFLPVLVSYLRIRFARALEQSEHARAPPKRPTASCSRCGPSSCACPELERLATIDDLTG